MQFHKKGIFLISIFFVLFISCQEEPRITYDIDDSTLNIGDIKNYNGNMYYLIRKWDTILLCKFNNDKFETLNNYLPKAYYRNLGIHHNVYNVMYDVPYHSLFQNQSNLYYFALYDKIIQINSNKFYNLFNYDYMLKIINVLSYRDELSYRDDLFYNWYFVDPYLYLVVNISPYSQKNDNFQYEYNYNNYLTAYQFYMFSTQSLYKFDLNNNFKAEKVECAEFGNENLKYIFHINNVKYVCSKNKIFQIDNCNKTIISEIADNDEIKYYHQSADNEVTFVTLKNNIITFDGNSYKYFAFDNLVHSQNNIIGNLIPLEIYKSKDVIYTIALEFESSTLYFFKYEPISGKLTKLFNNDYEFNKKNNFEISMTYKFLKQETGDKNIFLYNGIEPYKYDFAIETDNDGNVYFGCNGLFVFDKNDQLKQFYNARDISKMIYKGR